LTLPLPQVEWIGSKGQSQLPEEGNIGRGDGK